MTSAERDHATTELSLRQSISELQNDIECLTSDVTSKQAEIGSLQAELLTVRDKLVAAETGSAQERALWEQKLTDADAAFDNERTELREQLESMRNQIDEMKSRVNSNDSEKSREFAALQAECADINSKLQPTM